MSVPQDKPPFFKTWNAMYWFVFGNLVVVILLLYWFSQSFK